MNTPLLVRIACALLAVISTLHGQMPGTLDPSFAVSVTGTTDGKSPSAVTATAVQPDGKILIGGNFTTVNGKGVATGTSRGTLARLNPDGSLDPTFQLGSDVALEGNQRLAIQSDGKILVGINFPFLRPGGVADLVRLLPNGGLDPGFAAAIGKNTVTTVILLPGDKILVAGEVLDSNGSPTGEYLSRLNTDGSVDPTFVAGAVGKTLALQADGRILVGVSDPRTLVRLNSDGSLDFTFQRRLPAGSVASALAMQYTSQGEATSSVLVALSNGLPPGNGGQSQLVRLHLDGSMDTTFHPDPGVIGNIQTIFLQVDGKILLGGDFSGIDGAPHQGFVRLLYGGSRDHTFFVAAGADDALTSFSCQADGRLLMGGFFTSVDGVAHQKLARVTNDAAMSSLSVVVRQQLVWTRSGGSPEVDQTAFELSADNGVTWTLLGPGFRAGANWKFNLQTLLPASGLVRVSGWSSSGLIQQIQPFPSGNVDPSFGPTTTGGNVETTAIQTDGKIVIGGSFTHLDGRDAPRIARLNPDGSRDSSFQAGVDGTVTSIGIQPDGKILIAGTFQHVGVQSRNRFARLNGDGSLDADFQPALDEYSSVICFALQPDGKILLSGLAVTGGGSLVRLNGDGSVDSSFQRNHGTRVLCIAVQPDAEILIGSGLAGIDGYAVTRLKANGSPDPAFNSRVLLFGNSNIAALVLQPDGKILVGGTLIGSNNLSKSLVRLMPDGSLDGTFNFSTLISGFGGSIALQTDGKILLNVPNTYIARLTSNGAVDSTFSPSFKLTTTAGGSGPLVQSVALQADGQILIAGDFNGVNGLTSRSLARLGNDGGTQTLTFTKLTTVLWRRSGPLPEFTSVAFDISTDAGTTWNGLGMAERQPQLQGWTVSPINLPPSGLVRARGTTSGGFGTGSAGLVEEYLSFFNPSITALTIASSNPDPTIAKADDTLAITFTADSTLQSASANFSHQSVSALNIGGHTWQAKFAVSTDDLQGTAAFSVSGFPPTGPDSPIARAFKSTDGSAVVIDTIAPAIETGDVPPEGYEVGMLLPDLRRFVRVSELNGPVPLEQSPEPGTLLDTAAPTTITFAGADRAGNLGQATVLLPVRGSEPVQEVHAAAGDHIPGELPSTHHVTFGAPEIGAFTGILRAHGAESQALFGADGTVLLEEGGSLPGFPGAVIYYARNPNGDATLVTLRTGAGGVTSKDNVVLVTGVSAGRPYPAARIGTPTFGLPPGVVIARFLEIDGHGSSTFFTALLQKNGAAEMQSPSLCAVLEFGRINLLVQPGQSVGSKIVRSVATLMGSPGTLADGRWRVDSSTIGVRLTFSDHSQAIYTIPATAASSGEWTLLAQTGPITDLPGLDGAVIARFGLPGFGPAGAAAVAYLESGKGGATAANNAALIGRLGAASPPVVVARKGDAMAEAGIGVTLHSISDPVVGADAALAYEVTMAGGGFKAGANAGIEFAADGLTPTLIALATKSASDGSEWAGFSSLVLPQGHFRGPIFVATTETVARRTRGLWAVDSAGHLQSVLRSHGSVFLHGKERAVQSFTALKPAIGSIGAANGYDDEGNVAVSALFDDGSRAMIQIAVP